MGGLTEFLAFLAQLPPPQCECGTHMHDAGDICPNLSCRSCCAIEHADDEDCSIWRSEGLN